MRIRQLKSGLFVLTGAMIVAAASAQACVVSLGIPGNPPFTRLEGDKVSGVIAEVAILALEKVNCRAVPRKLPFPRMYKWVHGGKIDVATSVYKTPERASQAHYSVPIIAEYTVVMVPIGEIFPLDTPDDLSGKVIGGQLGFDYRWLKGRDLTLLRVRNYEVNIQRVAHSRIDGAIMGSITGRHIARNMGLADRVEFLPTALALMPLGIAVSKEAFSKKRRSRFDTEIQKVLASNRWKKILIANKVVDHGRVWPLVQTDRHAATHRIP